MHLCEQHYDLVLLYTYINKSYDEIQLSLAIRARKIKVLLSSVKASLGVFNPPDDDDRELKQSDSPLLVAICFNIYVQVKLVILLTWKTIHVFWGIESKTIIFAVRIEVIFVHKWFLKCQYLKRKLIISICILLDGYIVIV